MAEITSEVLEFIDRLAEIDRTHPAHDPEKVIASFKKRLAATGLTREVRWVTDPSGLIAADGNETGDQVAWPVWGAYETALACREKTAASDLRPNLWKMKAWNAYNSADDATYNAWLWACGYVISARRVMSEVEEA